MVKRADEGMSAEEIKEMEGFLELVSSESKRCGDIVTNLLSFSRRRQMAKQSLSVNEVMEKIILLLRHTMDLQKIHLKMSFTPDLPNILGDLNQVQQCFMNLIFNAMEAMPGGGDLLLSTRLVPDSNQVEIEVCDSGCGIAKEHMAKIFEPFFTTKSHEKGVGLGLAVVYGIVKEHRGEIEVKSEPGQGTRFRISFPVITY
jgi:two-component system, NtrC family, sensor kinase